MPQHPQHPAPPGARRLGCLQRGSGASRLDELAPQPGGLDTRADELGFHGGKLLRGTVGTLALPIRALLGLIGPLPLLIGAALLIVRPLFGSVGTVSLVLSALLGGFEPLTQIDRLGSPV